MLVSVGWVIASFGFGGLCGVLAMSVSLAKWKGDK